MSNFLSMVLENINTINYIIRDWSLCEEFNGHNIWGVTKTRNFNYFIKLVPPHWYFMAFYVILTNFIVTVASLASFNVIKFLVEEILLELWFLFKNNLGYVWKSFNHMFMFYVLKLMWRFIGEEGKMRDQEIKFSLIKRRWFLRIFTK